MTRYSVQRGAATLTVVMLLMLLGALSVMASAKVDFYSQKAATNTYHYGQAFSAAQAGLERGLSYLAYTGSSTPNRAMLYDGATRRLRQAAFPLVEQLPDSRSAYRITMTQPDESDLNVIQITSTGCADGCSPCTDNCAPSATVTQLVKMRNPVVGQPDAAVLARMDVNLSGNAVVKAPTNGLAIRAGGPVGVNDTSNVTGQIVQNDTRLAQSSVDELFSYFFGDTKASMKAQLPNLTGTVPASGTTGGAYWIEGNVSINSGTYGSPAEPMTLIVNGSFKMNSGTTVYGFVYVVGNNNAWENSGGTFTGTVVAEGAFRGSGQSSVTGSRQVLNNLTGGVLPVKVPGSWRDF